MKTSNLLFLSLLIAVIVFQGCKTNDPEPEPNPDNDMKDMIVPDGFTFETTQDIPLTIKMPASVEVHLAGDEPTALADQTMFGTFADDSTSLFTEEQACCCLWKNKSIYTLATPIMARNQKLEARSKITSSFGLPASNHKICRN